jgi:N-acyl-D-amino-acid deacylase
VRWASEKIAGQEAWNHLVRIDPFRKMCNASRVGLMDRGILHPGMFADVTVFDLNSIKDVATFQDPMHYSVGVKYVFVNGHPVIWDGAITQERSGRRLPGPGYQPSPR